MKSKFLIVIITFATAFLTTMAVGIISNVRANRSQDQSLTLAPSPNVEATLQADREEQYIKQIEEANLRIEQANQQILQLSQPVEVVPTITATVQLNLVSAEQAAELAKIYVGAYPKDLPLLVNFEQTPAYEVIFQNGKIYINAMTGDLLFNGLRTLPPQKTSEQAAKIAMQYMNNSSVTEISRGSFDGKSVYIIHFADGQSVYVDLYGKILAIQMAPAYSSIITNDEQNQETSYTNQEEDAEDVEDEHHEEVEIEDD